MRSIKIAVVAALVVGTPALAADFPEAPDLRPAFGEMFSDSGQGPVRFEFGTRYWYSWGKQEAGFTAPGIGDVNLAVDDRTHIGELHGKITDLSTQTYVNAIAGLGFSTSGTYNIAPASSGNIGPNSSIGYAGADFGWLPFGNMDGGVAIGGLVGYQYWKDAPDIGQGTYAASFDAGGNPASYGTAKDDFDIHALRLGVKMQADLSDQFDVQAEVAAVPYAWVTGSLGGSGSSPFMFPALGGAKVYERAPTTLSGHGYGAMGELMFGFHPTENLTLRLGGRAWYVQGDLEANFKSNTVVGPAVIQNADMNLKSNYARIFRYGALFELTGRF
ncbi:hypothetical protein PSQ19_00785 [Devosia algicola]|uniref:Porin family protein n=1 Tax=Devosia algicola TaxID=3026418 RepID=A0ABY7YNN5_9HYPH|nr:hypothetical protein [Devosia algicola]WDR02807.1 hypothetical protein PSQ19_00785 [Devosia algicola]